METKSVQSAQPSQLAKLLDPDSDSPTIYSGADPAVILRHQLQAPLTEELASSVAGVRLQSLELEADFKKFEDIFHHPHPPLEMLKRAKEYAKTCRNNHHLLPPEVATVLYYAALTAARVHADAKITQLSDADFRKGLDWAIAQPWMEEKLKELFRQGLEKVR